MPALPVSFSSNHYLSFCLLRCPACLPPLSCFPPASLTHVPLSPSPLSLTICPALPLLIRMHVHDHRIPHSPSLIIDSELTCSSGVSPDRLADLIGRSPAWLFIQRRAAVSSSSSASCPDAGRYWTPVTAWNGIVFAQKHQTRKGMDLCVRCFQRSAVDARLTDCRPLLLLPFLL